MTLFSWVIPLPVNYPGGSFEPCSHGLQGNWHYEAKILEKAVWVGCGTPAVPSVLMLGPLFKTEEQSLSPLMLLSLMLATYLMGESNNIYVCSLWHTSACAMTEPKYWNFLNMIPQFSILHYAFHCAIFTIYLTCCLSSQMWSTNILIILYTSQPYSYQH